MQRYVIMDVDTGVDDAIAIIAALHNYSDRLIGVTTVAGNTSSQQAALNTLFLLRQFSLVKPIPVHTGTERTLRGVSPSLIPQIHGSDGLGGVSHRYWATRSNPVMKTGAVEYLLDIASRFTDALSILATGPLTNIAQAIQQAPEIMGRIGRLFIMGGAVDRPGNITPYAEFNAYTDPEAFSVVLSSHLPITLFPLNVTEQVWMLASSLEGQLAPQVQKARLIRDITSRYCQFHLETLGFNGWFLHDVLPVVALGRPDLFQYESISLDIEVNDTKQRGRLCRRDKHNQPISVASRIKAREAIGTIWTTLQQRDPATLYTTLAS
ncbi:MAG: nucleoside hydrolase [Acidobacteria bacterium]|nr:nucleoside hydrolase [Acidobacteriota bacterium]|tara:strand:+ start:12057 stop:13025 length:969 start_codon:yes stop_codon:yes gene_type:complete